ncbi:MAG: nucleotidyltransferase [Thermodesulfobacteriota bacterium]|nr:nucleotidyltransferase [Thermodesulfobacteriota bacterium]
MDKFTSFMKVLGALEKKGVEYILVGGVAVVLQGLPRTTEDVDIFVKPEQANIERLREALMSVYNDTCIGEITLSELERYPVIRYGTPDGFCLDILARLGEAVAFDDLDMEVVEVHDVNVRVATPETLYRLKKDTVRPKDRQDALFLRKLIGQRSLKKEACDGDSSQ